MTGRDGHKFLRHNGDTITLDDLRQHLSDILSGMYSLGGQTDVALLQQRVHLAPGFRAGFFKGIPDIRVVLYKNKPALAMLRLPTQESGGRANLHQGGLGAGIDLATGITHHAVRFAQSIADPSRHRGLVAWPASSLLANDPGHVRQGRSRRRPGLHRRRYRR